MPKKDKNANKPWIHNYPPLRDWLNKLDARCNWQTPLGPAEQPNAYVESWMLSKGREMLIVVHANQLGWNIYTPDASNEIAKTIADAEARLGLS